MVKKKAPYGDVRHRIKKTGYVRYPWASWGILALLGSPAGIGSLGGPLKAISSWEHPALLRGPLLGDHHRGLSDHHMGP